MSNEPRPRAKIACDCCFEVTAVCAKTLLCAACVRHAAASFAIEVRRAEMKKAREELGKPPKGTA